MAFKLPKLPYDYSSLEPYIDEETMKLHHDKHHAGYVEKLNKALEEYPIIAKKEIEELLREIDKVPEEIRKNVINNGGGHANHSLFWEIMTPGGNKLVEGKLKETVNSSFGSMETFKEKFTEKAAAIFGSGWVWLIAKDNKLEIISLPNQESPLMSGETPILGLDVWEHAYYLHYNNRRAEYIDAWWNVVNFKKIEENYMKTSEK